MSYALEDLARRESATSAAEQRAADAAAQARIAQLLGSRI